MALSVRKTNDAMTFGLVLAHNTTRAAAGIVSTFFHADITATSGGDFMAPTVTSLTITAANASDLATSLTLANQIQSILAIHLADGISTNAYSAGAHQIPDTANNTSSPTAVDLATAITLANAWKTNINAHFTQSGVHFNNDGTNTVVAANATDQGTLNTLLNAIKTSYNAHVISSPAGQMLNILSA